MLIRLKARWKSVAECIFILWLCELMHRLTQDVHPRPRVFLNKRGNTILDCLILPPGSFWQRSPMAPQAKLALNFHGEERKKLSSNILFYYEKDFRNLLLTVRNVLHLLFQTITFHCKYKDLYFTYFLCCFSNNPLVLQISSPVFKRAI